MSGRSFGILACGSYLPRGRLAGSLIADANGWFDPSLKSKIGQQRTFCNWDEDALTMGVEAARVCLSNIDTAGIAQVDLASTTLPFADRSNVGILREALDLADTPALADSGGSQRAASSALSRALRAGTKSTSLIVGSECADPKPASQQEAVTGHAATAVLVGSGEPLAILSGAASQHQDFVDHYRMSGERFDYTLEARWTRDAGYRDQVAAVFDRALRDAGIDAADIDQLGIAAPAALARAIARHLKQKDTGADIQQSVGHCGAAHPLLLLQHLLAQSQINQKIALISIGQGIEVQIFAVEKPIAGGQLADAIADGVAETSYCRYLTLRGLLDIDEGIRAERDNRTAQSAFWRKHEILTGFKGGRCSGCDTLQFPPSEVCVNCGAQGTQEPRRMADMPGRVRSFTEDWLAYTQKPPLIFGNVGFDDGANVMMEFTDVDPGQLDVGMPVQMRFRIKDVDARRGFRRYFWKPTARRESGNG